MQPCWNATHHNCRHDERETTTHHPEPLSTVLMQLHTFRWVDEVCRGLVHVPRSPLLRGHVLCAGEGGAEGGAGHLGGGQPRLPAVQLQQGAQGSQLGGVQALPALPLPHQGHELIAQGVNPLHQEGELVTQSGLRCNKGWKGGTALGHVQESDNFRAS